MRNMGIINTVHLTNITYKLKHKFIFPGVRVIVLIFNHNLHISCVVRGSLLSNHNMGTGKILFLIY